MSLYYLLLETLQLFLELRLGNEDPVELVYLGPEPTSLGVDESGVRKVLGLCRRPRLIFVDKNMICYSEDVLSRVIAETGKKFEEALEKTEEGLYTLPKSPVKGDIDRRQCLDDLPVGITMCLCQLIGAGYWTIRT